MEKRKSIKTNAVLNIIRQFGKILFPLITFPYISRVLQAENYGKINFANSIISYFILLASFGASSYSIREGAAIRNDKKKIQEFSSQIFTINMISTLVSYALLALLMIFWEKMDEYRTLMLVLSGGIILTTLGVDWLYNIYEDYLYITVRSLAIQLLSLILMFIFVKKADDYIIYAWITVFASGCGNLFNFFHSRVYVKLKLTVRPMLKKHLKPMLVLFSNTIMITIYVSSDVTILGILENDTVVGIYSVAVKIYTLVKNIFNAIIVVTLPRLSYFIANGDQKAYKQLSEKIFKGLLVLALPTLLGLGALSKNAILIISGEEYLGGQQALRILCLHWGFLCLRLFLQRPFYCLIKERRKRFGPL